MLIKKRNFLNIMRGAKSELYNNFSLSRFQKSFKIPNLESTLRLEAIKNVVLSSKTNTSSPEKHKKKTS